MPSIPTPTVNGASPKTVLERDQSQWLFTPAELLLTPSILEGLPAAQELSNRQKGVNFITQVGIMLKLPQLTLATASVYLHRFFMRNPMQQPGKPGLHHYSVAATALFLATKVEENCRKMKELVVACCRVAQKQPNLVVDEHNKEYWKWRDTILHNEDLLLEALCFDLQLEQPYRILFDFLQYYSIQDNKILRNTSWAFLNDSHVTTLCVLHTPRVIAGAALFAGVRLAGVTLPDDDSGRAWWDHLGLDILEIQSACNLMFEVYENPHIPRVGQKEAYIREDDVNTFNQTRQYMSPRPDFSPGGQSFRSTSQGTKRDRDEADREGSAEWGAEAPKASGIETDAPSPKRQRIESADANGSASRLPQRAGTSRVPSTANVNGGNSSRVPPQARRTSFDDVQARIDDIINRSSSAASAREGEAPQPPSALPERPSSSHRRQSQQDTAPVSQADADSARQRPPSSNSNIGANSVEKEEPVSRQTENLFPASSDKRNDSMGEDKVDYGSEEGEL